MNRLGVMAGPGMVWPVSRVHSEASVSFMDHETDFLFLRKKTREEENVNVFVHDQRVKGKPETLDLQFLGKVETGK